MLPESRTWVTSSVCLNKGPTISPAGAQWARRPQAGAQWARLMRVKRTEEPHISRRAESPFTPLPRGVSSWSIPKLLFYGLWRLGLGLRSLRWSPRVAWMTCPVGPLKVVRWSRPPPRGPCAVPHLIGNGVDSRKQDHHASLSRLMSSLPSTSGLSVKSTITDELAYKSKTARAHVADIMWEGEEEDTRTDEMRKLSWRIR